MIFDLCSMSLLLLFYREFSLEWGEDLFQHRSGYASNTYKNIYRSPINMETKELNLNYTNTWVENYLGDSTPYQRCHFIHKIQNLVLFFWVMKPSTDNLCTQIFFPLNTRKILIMHNYSKQILKPLKVHIRVFVWNVELYKEDS